VVVVPEPATENVIFIIIPFSDRFEGCTVIFDILTEDKYLATCEKMVLLIVSKVESVMFSNKNLFIPTP